VIDVLWGLGLSTWLVLSVLRQTRWSHKLPIPGWLDAVGLFPGFGFFSPRVYQEDPHLFLRDEDEAGHAGAWRELRFRTLSPLRGVFHPTRRLEKAFGYSFEHLWNFPADEKVPVRGSVISVPYVFLRRFACEEEAAVGATHRRLMVCRSFCDGSDKPPVVVFISEPIPLIRGRLRVED
jgi:hypothetical protein